MIISAIERINNAVGEVVWGAPMLILIIGTGIYFTVRTKFFQLIYAKYIARETLFAIFRDNSVIKSRDKKSISQFQALSSALAATIGTGNIAGVAAAVLSGGAGAVFWMWISAFFGMMTGYAENVLGIYYRKKNSQGEWCGGAMYYLENGLKTKRGFKHLAKPLAVTFAIFCVCASFGIGNMTQINSASDALNSGFGIPPLATGITLAVLAAFVIMGGISRIGKVTEKLIPAMAVFYLACALVILIVNYKSIPFVFSSIFRCAFSVKAVAGGGIGFLTKQAISVGFKRGVFSNEAGLGSSVTVHAASDIKEPAVQGMWAIFEVFFDTILMCTLTAFAIISITVTPCAKTPVWTLEQALSAASSSTQQFILVDSKQQVNQPVMLLSETPKTFDSGGTEVFSYTNLMTVKLNSAGVAEVRAVSGASLMGFVFEQCFGSWAGKLLSVCVLTFAFSTVIGWSFYGKKALEYLFGVRAAKIYNIVYIIFIVIGATMELTLVWNISDTLNGLMALPNLTGVLVLSGTVMKISDNYISRKISKHPKRLAPVLSAY